MPVFHDQSHSENNLQRPTGARLLVALPESAVQRKRMLIALGVLLVALGAVIVRDWDFWFPPRVESPEAAALRKSKMVATGTQSTPAMANRERKPAQPTPPAAEAPLTATAERAALPPLEVEVVAGNRRVTVPAKSNAIHLDVGEGVPAPGANAAAAPGSSALAATGNATVSAAERVRLSAQTQQSVSSTVAPDYPLLARQMKVEGIVTLQALIARDGTIQELRVLSGPEILATAAREAVRQWHFRPYLQNGQPVETQARITVNFTISTN